MPEVVVTETRPRETKASRQMREEDDQTLAEYLRSLATATPIRVTVLRKRPRVWKGRTTEGTLDTFDEPISEEDIQEAFGGGTYQLKIQTPGSDGSWKYSAHRTIKIAGDPKLEGLPTSGGSDEQQEQPSVVRETMAMAKDMIARAEQRVDRVERGANGSRMDPSIQLMIEGMQEEQRELRNLLASKDERLHEMMAQQRGGSRSADTLLEKMVDADNARVTAIRTQVDSEVRSIRENAKAEAERAHQRFEDQTRRMEEAHQRELSHVVRTHEAQVKALEFSHATVADGYKREISHLDRELTTAKTELAEMRVRKEKSLIDSMTELATMKEALESFGGGSDKEETSTLERVIGTIMESPLAARIAGGPAAVGADLPSRRPAPQLEMPVNKPVQTPDGRILLRRADGNVVEIRRKTKAAPSGGDDTSSIDPADVKIAIEFMEAAIRNDTDPEDFAASARNLIPEEILEVLRSQGVDQFLASVASLEEGSPLATMHGKTWARSVAAILIGNG